jgi:hypothetical protein
MLQSNENSVSGRFSQVFISSFFMQLEATDGASLVQKTREGDSVPASARPRDPETIGNSSRSLFNLHPRCQIQRSSEEVVLYRRNKN